MIESRVVRCFYVVVHGKLGWTSTLADGRESKTLRPAGFHCHRFVLARDEKEAAEKAFCRVRRNLDKQTGWLVEGAAGLELEAEEVAPAPIHKLLRPDDTGHTFYDRE